MDSISRNQQIPRLLTSLVQCTFTTCYFIIETLQGFNFTLVRQMVEMLGNQLLYPHSMEQTLENIKIFYLLLLTHPI
jgi:hypothetical protein